MEISVGLAQESVGSTIPVSFGKFAEVQVFVPKEKFEEASDWLEVYEKAKIHQHKTGYTYFTL